MKRIVGVVVAAAVTGSGLVYGQSEGPRLDGNWQVTIEMQMAGMPQGMPPMTTTQCLTKEDVADPSRSVPQAQGRGAMPNNCKITDYKTVGNTVTWSLECGEPNPIKGTTEFVYSDDTYVGTMTLNMDQAGQPQTMTMKYNGKRLGDCSK